MPVLEPDAARAFASAWIAAWNAHDVEAVLAHYADDVTFTSPIAITIGDTPSGTVVGKPALRAYWTKALTLVPALHFELLDVLTGVDFVTLYYQGHRGRVAETFRLDASGQVRFATACYAIAP